MCFLSSHVDAPDPATCVCNSNFLLSLGTFAFGSRKVRSSRAIRVLSVMERHRVLSRPPSELLHDWQVGLRAYLPDKDNVPSKRSGTCLHKLCFSCDELRLHFFWPHQFGPLNPPSFEPSACLMSFSPCRPQSMSQHFGCGLRPLFFIMGE